MIIIGWKYGDNTATFQRMWGLAKGIAESGHRVCFVFLMPNNGKKHEGYIPNLECIYLSDKCKFSNKWLCLLRSLFCLFHIIHKGDVVLYYTFFPVLFVVGMIPQLNLLIEGNEYPPFILKRKNWGHLYLKWYLHLSRRAKQIFVISRKLREYFVSQGVSPDIVQVLNMTVDTERFEGLVKQPVKCRYIAYCGTVSNYKDGVNVLLEAFAIVASKVPDVNLYILGGMPYEEDRRLNLRIVRENRLEDRVYMPGVVSADVLPQYLKNADVLALARPDNVQAAYGFPTKLGEYLLTGNPVVVTRVGELDDFLRDKESCLFARPDSVEDFAAQLLWVLANPDEAKRIGENGKRVAERCFNYSVEAQKIVRVLQELNAKS